MQQPRPRYLLALSLALVWLVAVLFFYYWIHKPLPRSTHLLGDARFATPTTAMFGTMARAAWDIVSALIFVIIGAGIGRQIRERFFAEWQLSRGERLATDALLGLGILSSLVFIVGVIRLDTLTISLLLLIVAILTHQHIRTWLRDSWGLSQSVGRVRHWERVLLAFILFNLTMALIMAVAPPTKFDTLTYQLVGPEHAFNETQFISLPGSHFFGFPQLMNTLFAAQMTLTDGSLSAAAPLHWFIGLLILILTGSYGARRFSRGVGLLGVVVLLTATSFWLQFGWPYVDLIGAGFVFMAYIALETWHEEDDQRALILAAIFVGLAMSTKYTLIAGGIAAGIYILIYGKRSQLVLNGTILIGVATLVMIPWFARNIAFYDNPVYPYGPLTGEWDALHRDWYGGPEGALFNKAAWIWFTLPLSSTFLGVEGGGDFGATIGPLFVLLIPMLLMTWSRIDSVWRSRMKSMTVFILGITIVWLGVSTISGFGAQTRLWYGMFPLLALLAALGLDCLRLLPVKPLDFRFVLSAIIGLVLVLTSIDHIIGTRSTTGNLEGTTFDSHFLENGALQLMLGMFDEAQYLEDATGWHIVAIREVNNLPAGSQILFLWETRSLYCDERHITCIEDEILFNWYYALRTIGTPTDILQQWREQGVTHILVNENARRFELDRGDFLIPQAAGDAWAEAAGTLTPMWTGGNDYTLYDIRQ